MMECTLPRHVFDVHIFLILTSLKWYVIIRAENRTYNVIIIRLFITRSPQNAWYLFIGLPAFGGAVGDQGSKFTVEGYLFLLNLEP